MLASIVTAFYEGQAYLDNYIKTMVDNASNLEVGQFLKVFLVNDSPWVDLKTQDIVQKARDYSVQKSWVDLLDKKLSFEVITNEKNSGIHQTRVNGLKSLPCDCDYVMFLDQDDCISEHCIAHMLNAASEGTSVIVANAALQQSDLSFLDLYHSSYQKKRLGDIDTYLKVGTQIVSPGQTLVKVSDIPQAWTENICKKNGSDDYFLWLLLLEKGCKFHYLDESLYTHVYTSKNISADTRVTDDSNFEFIEFMKEKNLMSTEHIEVLEEMLRYKADFRLASKSGKIGLSLKHFSIFWTNLIFKIFSRTPYGFNR